MHHKSGKGKFSGTDRRRCLRLLEVQLEGKKRMTTDAFFLNGYTVEEGTYFTRG